MDTGMRLGNAGGTAAPYSVGSGVADCISHQEDGELV